MIVLDSQNNEYEIDNILAFAREYNLQPSTLNRVMNGKRYHHHGWHLPHVNLTKELVDPDGKVHKFYIQAAFCREHGLDPTCVSKLLNGDISHHKGWKIVR